MATIITYNLDLDAGCDFDGPVWTWESGGAAVDLTGATATARIRETSASAALVTLSESPDASGQVLLGGVAGTIQLTVTTFGVADITVEWGVWDLLLTLSSGKTITFAIGNVHVRQASA